MFLTLRPRKHKHTEKSSKFSPPMTFDSAQLGLNSAPCGLSTAAVLLLILVYHLLRILSRRRAFKAPDLAPRPQIASNSAPIRPKRVSRVIGEDDLRNLITSLKGDLTEMEKWEDIIDKRSDRVSYKAKSCRQKDGPAKYISITTFEKCSTELLRDFYMDNEYRKQWDKTLIHHEQLEVDESSGIEVGRLLKKFPLLTAREYILAWCVREGKDKSFYCITKDCEHPMAPRQRKYVRVGFYRSGWRIRKVPGRDACEITMMYEEDAGLNIEMAKLAFAKGVWSYITKMDIALRQYSSTNSTLSRSILTLQRIIQKVPPELENDLGTNLELPMDLEGVFDRQELVRKPDKLSRKSSKKWIANGLLLVGGIACLSRFRSTLGTQLAAAFILKKLMKPGSDTSRLDNNKLRRGRHSRRHFD